MVCVAWGKCWIIIYNVHIIYNHYVHYLPCGGVIVHILLFIILIYVRYAMYYIIKYKDPYIVHTEPYTREETTKYQSPMNTPRTGLLPATTTNLSSSPSLLLLHRGRKILRYLMISPPLYLTFWLNLVQFVDFQKVSVYVLF